jgi:hypothetical protein
VKHTATIATLGKILPPHFHSAHSPEAKGRIERAFQTAQDRLVKGLRQVGASDLEAANKYLQQVYLPLWNRRFRRQPQLAGDASPKILEISSMMAAIIGITMFLLSPS